MNVHWPENPGLRHSLILFFFGILPFFLPLFLIHWGLLETEAISFKSRKQAAIESRQVILDLAGNHDLEIAQMESRLQRFGDKIASESFFRSGGKPVADVLKTVVEENLDRLSQEDIVPTGVLALLHSYNANDSSKPGAILALEKGFDKTDRDFFWSILQNQVLSYLHIFDRKSEMDLTSMILPKLKVHISLSELGDEFRSKLVSCSFQNKGVFLYWMPLIPPRFSEVIDRLPIHDSQKKLTKNGYPEIARRQTCIGGILLLLPRDEVKRLTPEKFLAGFRGDKGICVGLLDRAGGRLQGINSESEKLMKHLLTIGENQAAEIGWVFATESIELDKTYSLVIAAKIEPVSPEFSDRHRRIRGFSLAGVLVGLFIWFLAVFARRGIPSSLRFQLLWGLGLAVLLPLSSVFLVSESFIEEYYESQLQESRLQLVREIMSVETRGYTHRLGFWNGLVSELKNPEVMKILDKFSGLSEKEAATRQKIGEELNKLFFPIFWGNQQSMRNVLISNIREVMVRISRDGYLTETDQFSEYLGFLGKSILKRLIDLPKIDGKQDLIELRQGLFWEYGTEFIYSLFGSELYYQMMNAWGYPSKMPMGTGDWGLLNIPLPDNSAPRFVATLIFISKDTDVAAFERTLFQQNKNEQVFVFRADQMGCPMIPENGESFPFLRQIARQVITGATRVSSRVDFNGETYLLEGSPFIFSKQFVSVGMAPVSRIKKMVEEMRRRIRIAELISILLVFFLSILASQDLLTPVNHLIRGMGEVQRGNFQNRIALDRGDELGNVIKAFNGMTRGLEEGKLMEKMVSFSARDAIESEALLEKARQGEKITATILYFGIPDFDKKLKTIETSKLFNSLNDQVKILCQCVVDHGGDIDKLMGDKILAYFRHDPEEAADVPGRVAKLIRELINNEKTDLLPFPFSLGINMGVVISGMLGSGERKDFTIIGDPVNVAARAQGVADAMTENRVVATEAASLILKPYFSCEVLDITSVKGKTEEVRLVRIL